MPGRPARHGGRGSRGGPGAPRRRPRPTATGSARPGRIRTARRWMRRSAGPRTAAAAAPPGTARWARGRQLLELVLEVHVDHRAVPVSRTALERAEHRLDQGLARLGVVVVEAP